MLALILVLLARPNRHRIQLKTQMNLVGGNDQPTGCDLEPNLLGREVRLALGDAQHLVRDHARRAASSWVTARSLRA